VLKKQAAFLRLGDFGGVTCGLFYLSTNKPVSKASQSNKDTVAASLPETVTEKATELQTKTASKNPETTATPPKTPTVFALKMLQQTAQTLTMSLLQMPRATTSFISPKRCKWLRICRAHQRQSVSGAVKYQGNQQYKITQSASVKGSFYIDESQLTADVTLLKNGIDFNPAPLPWPGNSYLVMITLVAGV
jgi:hypothetical protein